MPYKKIKPPAKIISSPSLGGNILVMGKWVYRGNDLRFAVTYLDPSGKDHTVYSFTAFSNDIKAAMLAKSGISA